METQERLDYLSYKNRPDKVVISINIKKSVLEAVLECDHKILIAPHFDVKIGSNQKCAQCAKEALLATDEFSHLIGKQT